MRSNARLAVVTVALVCAMAPCATHAAPPTPGAYHIVAPHRPLGPGESVDLTIVPPLPEDARVNWSVVIRGAAEFGHAVYRAPYVIGPGAPPVTIGVAISRPGVRDHATIQFELSPGALAGTEDCLGPGQSFSTVVADIVPHFMYADELPYLIRGAEPVYPRSEFVRGIADTIPVMALVCRTGNVIDAYAVPSYRTLDYPLQPIERDPKLVKAAVAAVLKYVFRPARVNGQAIAVWVATVVIVPR